MLTCCLDCFEVRCNAVYLKGSKESNEPQPQLALFTASHIFPTYLLRDLQDLFQNTFFVSSHRHKRDNTFRIEKKEFKCNCLFCMFYDVEGFRVGGAEGFTATVSLQGLKLKFTITTANLKNSDESRAAISI